jgi:hypothetical protein
VFRKALFAALATARAAKTPPAAAKIGDTSFLVTPGWGLSAVGDMRALLTPRKEGAMPPLGRTKGGGRIKSERTKTGPPVSGEETVERAASEEKARECQLDSIVDAARDQGKTVSCVMSWFFQWIWWDGVHERDASVSGKVAYDAGSDALAGTLSDYDYPLIPSMIPDQQPARVDPQFFIPCLIKIDRDGTVTTAPGSGGVSPGETPTSWRGTCVGSVLMGTFRYDWTTWRVELAVD